jgi:uncharacterized protein (TIGR03067 family)
MIQVTITLLAVGLLAPVGAGEKDRDKDSDALQGTWQVVSIELDGQKAPTEEVEKVGLAVKGAGYKQLVKDSVTEEGTIELDPSQKPRTIGLRITSGDDKDKTQLGIYKIERDTLTLCLARPGSLDRPKGFSTKEGSGHVLIVLKRKKG